MNDCIPPSIQRLRPGGIGAEIEQCQREATNVDYLEKKLISMDEQMAKLCRKLDQVETEKKALAQALIAVCREFSVLEAAERSPFDKFR